MKIRIRSLQGKLNKYKELLEKKMDYDHHLHVYNEQSQLEELINVEVDSMVDLFDIFEEFEEGMGEGYGHITVDVKNNIVYILDSWIE